MDELLRKHALEGRMTAGKVAQLAKPKLGQKPLSKEALDAQGARLLADLAARHAAELAELTERLARSALTGAPAAGADGGDAGGGGAGAAAAAAATSGAAPADESVAAGSAAQASAAPANAAAAAAAAGSAVPAPAAPPPPATSAAAAAAAPAATATAVAAVDGDGKKKSRKDRRKDKKAAERAGDSDDECAARASGPDAKELETRAIASQLAPLGLDIKPVPADGNCLFRAVSDQLQRVAAAGAGVGAGAGAVPDHAALRARAAEHIRAHADAFAPFLPYEPGDGYPEGVQPDPDLARRAVARYCSRLAGSACWGGHPELRALSCTLGLPLRVFQAGAPPLEITPERESMRSAARGGRRGGGGGDDDGDDDGGYAAALQRPSAVMRDGALALQLSFHRAYYTLGEHYNSVVPRGAGGARQEG